MLRLPCSGTIFLGGLKQALDAELLSRMRIYPGVGLLVNCMGDAKRFQVAKVRTYLLLLFALRCEHTHNIPTGKHCSSHAQQGMTMRSLPINHTGGFMAALHANLPTIMQALLNMENVYFFCRKGEAWKLTQ